MPQVALYYVKAALAGIVYLSSPVTIGALVAAFLLFLILRLFFGGLIGWLLRTALYVGGGVALLHYAPFQALFPDATKTVVRGRTGMTELWTDIVTGQHPGYVTALMLVVALWLVVSILSFVLRLILPAGEEGFVSMEARAAGAAVTPGQAFDVKRRYEGEQKQVMCIMMTDIVGYSAKMERDETATWELLKDHNVIMRRNITTHRGKEIKTIGDAFMVTFQYPIDALRCGIAMQKDLHEFNRGRAAADQVKVRIGIHQGEVIATAKDVFGEGVNIAARMESVTEPGGISVSAEIYEAAKNKVEAGFLDIGQPKMKNIANPPRVYRVQLAYQ